MCCREVSGGAESVSLDKVSSAHPSQSELLHIVEQASATAVRETGSSSNVATHSTAVGPDIDVSRHCDSSSPIYSMESLLHDPYADQPSQLRHDGSPN